MDEDGSGRIQFREFESFLRVKLEISKKTLSVDQMGALWKSVDYDGSGFLSADDFREFMDVGRPAAGETWQERLKADKDAEGQATRDYLAKTSGKDLAAKFADVDAADDETVTNISKLVNEQMLGQPPYLRDWFKMFAEVDKDGSGKISYAEVQGMLRRRLKISTSQLTELELQALWKALDADVSGLLESSDFGDL